MRFPHGRAHERRCIWTAGLGDDAVASWVAAQAQQTTDFDTDRARYCGFFHHCNDLLQRLPAKPQRNDAEAAAATTLLASAREHRERFLAAHAQALYEDRKSV